MTDDKPSTSTSSSAPPQHISPPLTRSRSQRSLEIDLTESPTHVTTPIPTTTPSHECTVALTQTHTPPSSLTTTITQEAQPCASTPTTTQPSLTCTPIITPTQISPTCATTSTLTYTSPIRTTTPTQGTTSCAATVVHTTPICTTTTTQASPTCATMDTPTHASAASATTLTQTPATITKTHSQNSAIAHATTTPSSPPLDADTIDLEDMRPSPTPPAHSPLPESYARAAQKQVKKNTNTFTEFRSDLAPVFVNSSQSTTLLTLSALFDRKVKPIQNYHITLAPNSRDYSVKLYCRQDYTNYVKLLRQERVQFHLMPKPSDRTIRFVIKGLHAKISGEHIRQELAQLHQLEVIRAVQMHKRNHTRAPLPMFLVELADTPANRKIVDLRYVAHFRVKVEEYRTAPAPKQCKKCQMLYHNATECQAPTPTCAKCKGTHPSYSCSVPLKDRQCALCNGTGHGATWRGCPKYQAALSTSRPKEQPTRTPSPTVQQITQTAVPVGQWLTQDRRGRNRPTPEPCPQTTEIEQVTDLSPVADGGRASPDRPPAPHERTQTATQHKQHNTTNTQTPTRTPPPPLGDSYFSPTALTTADAFSNGMALRELLLCLGVSQDVAYDDFIEHTRWLLGLILNTDTEPMYLFNHLARYLCVLTTYI